MADTGTLASNTTRSFTVHLSNVCLFGKVFCRGRTSGCAMGDDQGCNRSNTSEKTAKGFENWRKCFPIADVGKLHYPGVSRPLSDLSTGAYEELIPGVSGRILGAFQEQH